MKSDEIGCCRAWVKEDPQAFYEGTDYYGDAIVVKLGSVVAIALATPPAIAEAAAELPELAPGDHIRIERWGVSQDLAHRLSQLTFKRFHAFSFLVRGLS